MPPPISLVHQKFRHVDHLEYMNAAEMQSFVGYWQTCQQDDPLAQRGAFLYGYYREDAHYEDGVRAVLEAVWEPDQGDWSSNPKTQGGVQFSKEYNLDRFSAKAKQSQYGGLGTGWDSKIPDLVAARLGLEIIGWVY